MYSERSSSMQPQIPKQSQQSYETDVQKLQRRDGSQCGELVRQFANDVLRTARAATAFGNKVNNFGNKINDLRSGTISLSDLNQALNPIIPPSIPKEGPPPRDPFRDADFTRISELLNLYGEIEWSKRPRTFTLLRMIDSIDAIEAFIADGLSDFSLPYTEKNLPNAVKGAQPRRRFLDLQSLVLGTHAADLEKGGRHMNFHQSADHYFQSLKELGDGGFGQVDHVWSRISLRDFARKRIPRGRSFKQDKVNIANFAKELETLKLLSHRHLVRLIGSYTDPKFVGLIMHPVADMNLATYLTREMDFRERQICLRRFYGCLASAVLYLHDEQIRHKDIKPANVLVRGTDVFLTDFGTSRHWSDGDRSTTAGTAPAYTPRYCPPEVADHEERRTSADIWSLGCCFLEMTTVLNNRTIREMKNFLGGNGTQSEFFYANEDATNLWIEKLKRESESRDDIEPLKELVPWMLQRLAKERPTAQQVTNCILNFETRQAFYGICCGNDDTTIQSTYEDLPPSYTESNIGDLSEQSWSSIMSHDDSTTKESTRSSPDGEKPESDYLDQDTVRALSAPPKRLEAQMASDSTKSAVERIEGKTISVAGAGQSQDDVQDRETLGDLLLAPKEPEVRVAIDAARASVEHEPGGDLLDQHNQSCLPQATGLGQDEVIDFLELKRLGKLSILYCLWPSCPANIDRKPFSTTETLQKHYRSAHETHDFSWSCLLDNSRSHATRLRESLNRAPDVDVAVISVGPKDDGLSQKQNWELLLTPHGSESVDPPEINLLRSKSPAMDHGNSVKDFIIPVRDEPTSPKTGYQPTKGKVNSSTSPQRSSTTQSNTGVPKQGRENNSRAETGAGKRVRVGNINDGIHETSNSRFTLLPNDRRPEPTVEPTQVDESDAGSDAYVDIPPEPLSLPSIGKGARWGFKESLPASSRAPSFVLACANRFTSVEVDALLPQFHLSVLSPPLFVYGSFMFPSIIKAQAEKSLKGMYSSRHQRRLVPTFQDWAWASFSLKHTAEIMTPAVLKGFDRWKPRGLRCAAIQDSRFTRDAIAGEPLRLPRGSEGMPIASFFPGYVQGFLLFGLTEEVLKTCEEMFPLKDCQSRNWQRSSMARKQNKSRGSDMEDEGPPKEHFKRKKVNVDIELKDGRIRNVEAVTYVWAHNFGLEGPWEINDFIKRPCFRLSSQYEKNDDRWLAEERELAKTMKIVYTLPGDALGRAVKEGDFPAVETLLDGGEDIDGACRSYGTALQTAVVTGNEEMVRFLVNEGADVNKNGGQYHTPLLAAVVCGHEEIVRFLLRRHAEVLADCGRYVSPLYQAISHSDEDITYLLLERGAWLSKGYNELLDLAAERGNEAIMDLLVDYDVRKIHYGLSAYRDYRGRLERRSKYNRSGQELSITSGAVLRAVISQALLLKGSHGTWQGRKGVQVLKAALEAGAPEQVVDHVGDNLKTVSRLIDYFRNAVTDMLDPQLPSTKNLESSHDGDVVVEEVPESSDSSNTSDDDATLIGNSSSARNQLPLGDRLRNERIQTHQKAYLPYQLLGSENERALIRRVTIPESPALLPATKEKCATLAMGEADAKGLVIGVLTAKALVVNG